MDKKPKTILKRPPQYIKTDISVERPYSSFNTQIRARRLLNQKKDIHPLTEQNALADQRKRPMTSTLTTSKNIPPKLDVLNLIIETSPNKMNFTKINKKIRQLNRLYTPISACTTTTAETTNFPSFLNNQKTAEIYYKYNLLYGSNTNNLIRTYSPKMRPMSSSIGEYAKSLKIDTQVEYVFDQNEIVELINAKCIDLGIELRDNMVSKFTDYCNSKCKNRKVDLSECYLGITSINIISNILIYDPFRISQLILAHNQIGDKGIIILCNSIKNSKSLVMLNVMSNSITHKGGQVLIDMLIDHKSLVSVNVSSSEGVNRNRLSYKGLKNIEKVLENNKMLEYFNISGNSIKCEGLELIVNGLNKNTTLSSLSIANNDLDKNALNTALDKLKISRISDINLSNNPIYKDGLTNFVTHLRNFPYLKKINISHCNLDFNSIFDLFVQLETMKRIDTLDVSENDINHKRFFQLKEVFNHINLKSLNMSKCNLGNKCAYILGECLQSNESLRKLELSDNKIYDSGFASFIPLIEKNKSIKYIDLSKNFIGDITAIDFFENLKYNHTLKFINLYDNQLRNDSGTKLIEILDSNKSLRTVNLGFNRVQMNVIEEMNKRLKVNAAKEKDKKVPLQKKIKDLRFRPDEKTSTIKQINKEAEKNKDLQNKLLEESGQYPIKKAEIKVKLEKMEEQNKELNEKNQSLYKTVVEINNKISENKRIFEKQREELLEKIEIAKKEIDEQTKIREENLDVKMKKEMELEYNTSTLLDSNKKIAKSLELTSHRVESLKKEIEDKKIRLEKLKNPPMTLMTHTQSSTNSIVPVKKKNLKKLSSKKSEDIKFGEKNNNNDLGITNNAKNVGKGMEIAEDEKEDEEGENNNLNKKKKKKGKKGEKDKGDKDKEDKDKKKGGANLKTESDAPLVNSENTISGFEATGTAILNSNLTNSKEDNNKGKGGDSKKGKKGKKK